MNAPAAPIPDRLVLTINGGSSSIKFALFSASGKLQRRLHGGIQGIGAPAAKLAVKSAGRIGGVEECVDAPDHKKAALVLMRWLKAHVEAGALVAVGHRIVHGGAKYWQPQALTPGVVAALSRLSPFDPEHLPEEILLARVLRRQFPGVPQIACFDTAFHHDLPRVAQLLPIPRRYHAQGVRRYGFHGLSCEYLIGELARLAGAKAARGRVILAHLGNGASITAVHGGQSQDTSMSFTPTAGLTMSTRSGDLDPGLGWYFARTLKMTARQFHQMVNHESGLLGISATSSDMGVLLAKEKTDARAAEAVALFCHQARKWLCAMAGVLGGVDTVVFSGGIGEHAAAIRARMCQRLEFMGIRLDAARNQAGAPVISAADSAVTVRVIPTDEERVIARTVRQFFKIRTKERS